MMTEVRLGIDVACTAKHQASLADETGQFLWQGWKFRTSSAELDALWDKIPDGFDVVVVMEPTRNAWVPLAAWLRAKGARVSVVPPEQSADLRDYYSKHTKTDRLDSKMLARMPMLHPDGLRVMDDLGPAEPLKRAVRHRSALQAKRVACSMRLDALMELMGPHWLDVFGHVKYNKTALAVLERFANPHALKRLGRSRLTKLVIRHSKGHFREAKADDLLAAADETLKIWAAGGLDFEELADDIAIEIRQIRHLDTEIVALDDRSAHLYEQRDPNGIIRSAPGVGPTLSAGILGRFGDLNRFHSLAGVRAFTGLVPNVDQSGVADVKQGITKKGDPGLRMNLYLAADQARKIDPTLAARYHRLFVEQGKHHNSAICSIAGVLATRIAACWRNGQHYELRDVDGTPITELEGKNICAQRYWIDPKIRNKRSVHAAGIKYRNSLKAKTKAGRENKESQSAPFPNPPKPDDTRAA
ncbi:MAG: IS110 family transposase [Acidimicrobiia bacterium]|nr:IS110 family transposase [Acidimicrobiia bacterium]